MKDNTTSLNDRLRKGIDVTLYPLPFKKGGKINAPANKNDKTNTPFEYAKGGKPSFKEEKGFSRVKGLFMSRQARDKAEIENVMTRQNPRQIALRSNKIKDPASGRTARQVNLGFRDTVASPSSPRQDIPGGTSDVETFIPADFQDGNIFYRQTTGPLAAGESESKWKTREMIQKAEGTGAKRTPQSAYRDMISYSADGKDELAGFIEKVRLDFPPQVIEAVPAQKEKQFGATYITTDGGGNNKTSGWAHKTDLEHIKKGVIEHKGGKQRKYKHSDERKAGKKFRIS